MPTLVAPITVSYNPSGVDRLRLSPDTLAKIFMRTLKSWDAAEIKADNPGVNLPARNLTVVHRSDGPGTTSNITKYLAAAAPSAWTLGSGDTVKLAADTQGGDKYGYGRGSARTPTSSTPCGGSATVSCRRRDGWDRRDPGGWFAYPTVRTRRPSADPLV